LDKVTLAFQYGTWHETDPHGTVYLHESQRWVLVHLGHDDDAPDAGWYLFGPGEPGQCLAQDDGAPAMALLKAGLAADKIIGPMLT
jgi:hypothetical protein